MCNTDLEDLLDGILGVGSLRCSVSD